MGCCSCPIKRHTPRCLLCFFLVCIIIQSVDASPTSTKSTAPANAKTKSQQPVINKAKKDRLDWKTFEEGMAESKRTGKYALLILYDNKDEWSNRLRQQLIASKVFHKESKNFVLIRTRPHLLQGDIAAYFQDVCILYSSIIILFLLLLILPFTP